MPLLYAQSHDGIDYVVVILLQCLHSFVPRDTCLSHDKLNVLVLKTCSIDLLSIILILILLVVTSLDGLAFSVVMAGVIVTRVIMASVVVGVLSSKLLSGRSLCLGIEILNFGLTKNTVLSSLASISQHHD